MKKVFITTDPLRYDRMVKNPDLPSVALDGSKLRIYAIKISVSE